MQINRIKAACYVTVCTVLLCGMNVIYQKRHVQKEDGVYDTPLVVYEEPDGPMDHLDEAFAADADFVSGLPIVVLDMNGEEPPITALFNEESMLYETQPDIEPYVEGTIRVIAGAGLNRIADKPSWESNMVIKRRGNTSMEYAKPQYLVKLRTESGQENKASLLHMGEDDEWVLNGSMSDPSMMRNYLCYKVAAGVTESAPDTQYCEVFIYRDGQYVYQGVYLLGENIKQGEHRVDVSAYKASDVYTSYIVRRDRYDEQDIMLDTPATREALSYGYLGLIYPGRNKVTKETIDYIERDISSIESVLYSDKYIEFSAYPEYIDVDSFVNYFIINEFFGNYDAGNHSTYMYKELGGKLKIGPVWDFDGAIDNYTLKEMTEEHISFYSAPWFDRLIQDESFLEKVQKQYSRLRRTILSEANIMRMIEDTQKYLRAAKQREWSRWQEAYLEPHIFALQDYRDEQGDIIVRQSDSYEQEIYRIKTVLRKHGAAIAGDLKELKKDCKWNTQDLNRNSILLAVCLAIFFIPVIYVSKEK